MKEVEARLEALLRDFGPFLRGIARRLQPRDQGIPVEEIEQEVRIRLWRALEADVEIREPASYLYRITATAAIDAVRRVKARREEALPGIDGEVETEPLADERSTPEGWARRREMREKIQGALAGLAEERRRAVGLHLQGFTTEEVAGLLGWTEPKARNLVYRGLDDLRSSLRTAGVDIDVVTSAT